MNGQQQNANPVLKNDPMLPVGDRPFWDQEYSEDESQDVQSVADSFVLLKSLKQSRDRWTFHTFPRFSSKGRSSKAPDVAPPPANTIQNRGKCDVEIGPHIFYDTIFYEVHYLSSPVPYSAPTTSQNPTSNPYWHSSTPYGSPYSFNVPPSNPTPSTSAAATSAPTSQSEIVSTPLISSLTEASITPTLINQVNVAASTNPILSNLLQLAAANRASEDQLKTLGLLIQSLANMESALAASNASSSQLQPPSQTPSFSTNYYRLPTQPPIKESDFVIEFSEAPNDRWLIPRGSVFAQRLPHAMPSNPDIELTICIPSDGRMAANNLQQTNTESIDLPVTLRLKEAPETLWDTIVRWAGGEGKMNANKKYLDSLVPPKRLYLGLQLPHGPLLTQLQTACAPSYTMKTLRQGPAPSRQKRSYTSRRTERSSTANPGKSGDTSTDAVVVKRPRASQSKSSTSTPIQCLSCKQTDVPLILGGRFCRPCVDSGNWTPLPTVPPVQAKPQ